MTHKELVHIAESQLKKWRCLPVCCEMACLNTSGEIADAIGWTGRASILFECKSTRNDFLRDKDKLFRFLIPSAGMGDWRFYLTNPGVIRSEQEMPYGWGCYEVTDNGSFKHKFGVKYSNACSIHLHGNKQEELHLMRSWIRRHQEVYK